MSDSLEVRSSSDYVPDRSANRQLECAALAWVVHNRATRGSNAPMHLDVSSIPLAEVDPTRGATRFHRHDEAPVWARHLIPTALIGAYLFFAD